MDKVCLSYLVPENGVNYEYFFLILVQWLDFDSLKLAWWGVYAMEICKHYKSGAYDSSPPLLNIY